MIIDTGVFNPSILGLNLFPFETSTDYKELYNQSGWSGPMQGLKTSAYSGFSGMFGPGTFYPGSGNLDQMMRAYWSVKAWLLTVRLYRVADAGTVDCTDFGVPVTVFTQCTIGGFGGEVGTLETAEIFTKILTTQDYCSYNSGPLNVNRTGVCPAVGDPNFTSDSVCVPVNPIQKFDDLLCRNAYFTWKPLDNDIKSFESGKYLDVKTPYRYNFTQFRVLSAPFFDCQGIQPSYDAANSIFTLSLMNPEIIGYSGSCLKFVTGYKPELQSDRPFDLYGTSGETIVDRWGQVTGYGINPKPSGISTPPLFDIGTGIAELGITGNLERASYFPFCYFQLRLKNNQAVSSLCPVNDTVSTLLTRNNQALCGSFTLYDQPLSGGFSNSGRAARAIFNTPLFGSTTAQQLFAQVTLEPTAFWVDSSGNANY